ncbi:MAG: alpha/beta hydrolase [Calditrichaeota bacterium]|jgi:pimeloyl-ACP methyl ester carboxylesterase|nr:alpha/beta hydrolase [Calditrichota bacterium]MBT7617715.1 alpha/beta hydrolase [Calditrichota bacterium]MBT7789812.1 alpha/beta hydrolase [Calditrichota bacterium]
MKFLEKTLLVTLVCTVISCFYFDIASADETDTTEFVYVFHGLGRPKSAMWLMAARLENAGYSVEKIGYHSLIESPEEIMLDISEQISASLPQDNRTIHFVGHSMGGLLIRAYLDSNKVEHLGRVVLIGTPNQGSALVDKYRDKWWMKILGPMPRALGTDSTGFHKSIGDPYYPVGIIAGIAKWKNEDVLPGDDDGIVPLESAKLKGMTDIITVESGHTMLRYDKDVADQTIEFLRNGMFREDEPLIER